MDKTSKLFLESEIKRILNLNERIESKDFILENVTPELQKSLDGVIGIIVQILSAQKSNDVSEVKPFINDILYDNMLKPRTYCGGGGMVQCKDLVDFFKYRVENAGDFTGLSGATNAYNAFKRDLDNLKGDNEKLKEYIKSQSGKDVILNPIIFDDSEIDRFLEKYNSIKDGVQKYNLGILNFDSFIGKMRELLKKGEFCDKFNVTEYCSQKQMNILRDKEIERYQNEIDQHRYLDPMINEFIDRVKENREEIKQTQRIKDSEFDGLVSELEDSLQNGSFFRKEYPNVDLKDKNEVKKSFLLYLQKLKQGSLRPIDIKKLMDHFDKNIYPGLAANTSEDFAKSARSDFEEKLSSGTFCEECESRKEIQKKALVAMKTLLKYSDGDIPKGLGKFEFLQGKIDDLLVVNQKEGSDDEEGAKNIPLDKLKNMGGKNIKIKYTPNDILKSDPKMETFIQMSKGILKGKFNTPPVSGKGDLEIIFYGDDGSGVYKFIMPAKKGLSYPKWHEIRIMELDETDNKFKFLYPHKPKFKIKITDVK